MFTPSGRDTSTVAFNHSSFGVSKMKKDVREAVSRILTEDVLSLEQARAELSRTLGTRVDKSTICRWIHRGAFGVKLEAIRLGGRSIFTSTQALNRFIVERSKSLCE